MCDKNSIETSDPAYGFRFPKSRDQALNQDTAATTRCSSWQTLVMNFCGRNITVASDKLPALSGLAQRYAVVTGYPAADYLSGLWRSTLVSDLMWSRAEGYSSVSSTPDTEKTGRRPGRAPTWSWASVDGAIVYFSPIGGRVPENVQVEDSHATKRPGNEGDPFSQVDLRSMVIACPYLRLWARRMTQEPGRLYCQLFDDLGGFVCLLTVDDPSEMADITKGEHVTSIESSLVHPANKNLGCIEVFCLGLMVETKPRKNIDKFVWHGIAVRQLVGTQTFARVGVYWTTDFKPAGEAKFCIS